jgi:endoribonuclease Dicer
MIAVYLIKYILDLEEQHREAGNPPRVAFFLVDSVHLMFQQYGVVDSHIQQPASPFCGDMGCDLWDMAEWRRHFSENMVIVCTAQILMNCLTHSFIKMEEINLLIFDEAHRAKKNHVYAQIMRQFYTEIEESKRPRVLGLTASPVHGNRDIEAAATTLEVLLNAQIATASDMAKMRQVVSRPKEMPLDYPPLLANYYTELGWKMRHKFLEIPALKKTFIFLETAAAELGSWCADRIWHYLSDSKELEKLRQRIQKSVRDGWDFKTQRNPSMIVDQIRSEIRPKDFSPLTDQGLSSKVLCLRNFLEATYQEEPSAKCIIFAKERRTVRILSDLFEKLRILNMRIGTLIGNTDDESAEFSLTYKQHQDTLNSFREGSINCIFATSVAEEGLDIPDCNLVIRFSLTDTMIAHVQSRGRARHPASHYVIMKEEGNMEQEAFIEEIQKQEIKMGEYCQALPDDRSFTELDLPLGNVDEEKFVVESTGALLNHNSSLQILNRFAALLPIGQTKVEPRIQAHTKGFICEMTLPDAAPVSYAIGRPFSQKIVAKRSAAYHFCLKLHEKGYLNDQLLPVLPDRDAAKMPQNPKAPILDESTTYDLQLKPRFWSQRLGNDPTNLYITIVEMVGASQESIGFEPVALLTRDPLPSIPPFSVYPKEGCIAHVICHPLEGPLELDKDFLDQLTGFTLRIYEDVFNKVYEYDISNMTHWFAPVRQGIGPFHDIPSSANVIAKDLLKLTSLTDELEWEDNPDTFWNDKYIVDRHTGSRRYFSEGIAEGLGPLDPVPSDAAIYKRMDNILEYSNTLGEKYRQLYDSDPKQPVILARLHDQRLNWLEKPKPEEILVNSKAYICPGPFKISTIPANFAETAYMLPSLMHQLDSFLLAEELYKEVELDVPLDLALQSITKNFTAFTTVDASDPLTYGANYERLEFIGDTFLKLAGSIAVFLNHPEAEEYQLHVLRGICVMNDNLWQVARNTDLPKYIRSSGFSRRTWYPQELKLLKGKGFGSKPTNIVHNLSGKTIADVCEAIIGTAFVNDMCNESKTLDGTRFDRAVRMVTKFVGNKNHEYLCWADYYSKYRPPTFQVALASEATKDLAKAVEEMHPYHFRYPNLLRSAFNHGSNNILISDDVPGYQRLEFIGDSLIDMCCVRYLFAKYPDRDPQWLTEHKGDMVSNRFFSALCVKLGFHNHIIHQSEPLSKNIVDFTEELELVKGQTGETGYFWDAVKQRNKVLADVVESYVGAIFIDSGFRFEFVEEFFNKHILPYFLDIDQRETYAESNARRKLQSLISQRYNCNGLWVESEAAALMNNKKNSQSRDGRGRRFATTQAAVLVHSKVIAQAEAASSQEAKTLASKDAIIALERFKDRPTREFREFVGCDCATAEDFAEEDEDMELDI